MGRRHGWKEIRDKIDEMNRRGENPDISDVLHELDMEDDKIDPPILRPVEDILRDVAVLANEDAKSKQDDLPESRRDWPPFIRNGAEFTQTLGSSLGNPEESIQMEPCDHEDPDNSGSCIKCQLPREEWDLDEWESASTPSAEDDTPDEPTSELDHA